MNADALASVLSGRGLKVRKTSNGWDACCPTHTDRNPSLGIHERADGKVLIHCRADCKSEDVLSALGLTFKDLEPAQERAATPQRRIVATYDYQDERGAHLFQVVRFDPKDFRQRRKDSAKPDGWDWSTKGVRRVPYRLGIVRAALSSSTRLWIVEGEKDVEALIEAGEAATCNAGGAGKFGPELAGHFNGADAVIIADRDEPGRKHAQGVAGILGPVAKSVRVIEVPDVGGKQCKDVTDFISAGGTVEELSAIADSTPDWSPKSVTTVTPQGILSEYLPQAGEDAPEQPIKLTVRRPFEILALPDDPDDNLLGDRLLSKGNPLVILGPGGCHKSRLLLQLAAAMATGRNFHGLPTHTQDKRWLILQAENDNRRLKYDLEAIKAWLTPEEWEQFNDLVHIHTLESEWDCMVALDDPEAVARMAALIEETTPDIVGVDSFYNVGIGDLNRDVDMRNSCMALAQLVKRGNPKRATVVLHHALTGKAGALKSTGWDRSSYGRNSKLLHSWTRGQINVAPGSDDGTSVVLSCGKASNGKEFEPRAAKLDSSGILLPDPDFDFSAWEFEVSDGTRRKSAAVCVNDVAALARDLAKGDLVKALIDEHGIAKTRAYELVAEAEKKRLIVRSPLSRRFNPK